MSEFNFNFGCQARSLILPLREGEAGHTMDPLTSKTTTSGYVVGNGFDSLVFDSVEDIVPERVGQWLSILEFDDLQVVGSWVDSSDGKVYFDLSELYFFRQDAQAAAERNDQIAYFLLDTGTEFTTSDYVASDWDENEE